MREQRTLFDLTQDGLVIGKKIQRIYPEVRCVGFRFGRSDGDGGTDNLQRNESYRSRPAPASPAELFRCTCYLDNVRRDRGSIETRYDTRPPKTISNKIPAATESIIGRRDPK